MPIYETDQIYAILTDLPDTLDFDLDELSDFATDTNAFAVRFAIWLRDRQLHNQTHEEWLSELPQLALDWHNHFMGSFESKGDFAQFLIASLAIDVDRYLVVDWEETYHHSFRYYYDDYENKVHGTWDFYANA